MSVGLEYYAFCLEQRALKVPPWGGTSFFIHDTMTRQKFCFRRIAQGTAYHS